MTIDNLSRRLVAEAIGTGLLLAAVVGSGVMAERLAGGNIALALLANTLATAGALVALILTFGPISGAHFNPAVTLAFAARKALPWGAVPGYLLAQLVGAVLGVWLAHVMFGLTILQASAHARRDLDNGRASSPRPSRCSPSSGAARGIIRMRRPTLSAASSRPPTGSPHPPLSPTRR